MACRLPEHAGTWNTDGQPIDCPCDGNGKFGGSKIMKATVRYTATITQSPEVQITVSTFDSLEGLGVCWAGAVLSTKRDTSGKVVVFDSIASVSPDIYRYWHSHEDAIADAVAWFDGTDTECSDEYTGETVPTGWDAADHKAMYE